MVKMISGGNTVICDRCKCIFSYEDEDVTKQYGARREYYQLYSKRIRCPNCGKEKHLGTFEEFYDENAKYNYWLKKDLEYFGCK